MRSAHDLGIQPVREPLTGLLLLALWLMLFAASASLAEEGGRASSPGTQTQEAAAAFEENKQLADEIARGDGLERRLAVATEEVARLREVGADLDRKLRKAEAAAEATRAEVDAGAARARELEQEVAELKVENARLVGELQGALRQAEALGKERDDLQSQLVAQAAEAERTLAELRANVAAAEREVGELEEAKAGVQAELVAAEKRAEALETELEEVGSVLAARAAEAEGEMAQQQAALEASRKEASELARAQERLQADLAATSARVVEFEGTNVTLRGAKERLERELQGALKQIDVLIKERDGLQLKLQAQAQKSERAVNELRDAVAAAEQRSTRLEEARAALASQLDAQQVRLQGELDQNREKTRKLAAAKEQVERSLAESAMRAGELEARLGELDDVKAELEEKLVQARGRIGTLEEDAADLRGRVSELGALAERQQAELAEAAQVKASLEAELADLRGRLGPAEGGAATPADARTKAADAVKVFRERLMQVQKEGETPEVQAGLDEARREMRASQFLVAKLSGASGARTVLTGESLGLIAARVYGDANRWPEVYDANRHVLANPDRIFPGMVLVIP